MKILRVLILGMLIFTVMACGKADKKEENLPTKIKNGKPEWVFNSTMGGKYKLAGVGISGPHSKGKSAQRKLSVARAIDEIASQLGTEVQSVTKVKSSGTRAKSSTSLESYSVQTVNGQTVVARIIEMWPDTKTSELYTWMVVEK